MKKIIIAFVFILWCHACAPEHENLFPYVLSAKRISNCAPEKPYRILALDKNLLYPGITQYPMFTNICSQTGPNVLSSLQGALDSYYVPLILCRDGISERDSIVVEFTIQQRTSGKRLAFFRETLYRGDTLVLSGTF